MREEICLNCGKKMVPATECTRDFDGQWDEHTFKCECSPGIYLSIG